MYFASFAEFIAMDGHGFYVWTSYGAMTLGLLGLWWRHRRTRQQWLKQQQQWMKRQAASSTHTS